MREEERWKERDYEGFLRMEYEVTKRPQEPIPASAIMQVVEDGEEIFGAAVIQSTESNTNRKEI